MPTAGYRSHEIAVAIVDGEEIVHAGLRAWLALADPAIVIAGAFGRESEFLTAHPTAAAIDVVLYEPWGGRQRCNLDGLKAICEAGYRVVVFSHLSADRAVIASLEAGAVSYLLKAECREQLCEAIYSAASGRRHVSPLMATALLGSDGERPPRLSERERDVLVTWLCVDTKQQVAERLFIEVTTVSSYLQRIRAKYAAAGRPAHTKASLMVRAIRDGILSAEYLDKAL